MTVERRESLVLIASSGLTALLSFLFVAYSSRLLGPGGAADFLAAVFLATALATAAAPINGTVTRFTGLYAARGDLDGVRHLAGTMTRAIATWGCLALAVLLLLAVPLGRVLDFRSPASPALAMLIGLLAVLAGVPQGVLRGLRRFGQLGLNTILDAAVRLLGAILLLAWVAAPQPALTAFALGLAAAFGLGVRQLRHLPSGEPQSAVSPVELRRFALPMFVLAATAAAFANLDILLVKGLFPRQQAGLYGAAAALARGVAILFTPFRVHALPLMVSLRADEQPLLPALGRLSFRFLALATPWIVVLLIWPDEISRLVYGDEFADAGGLLLPLVLVALFGSLSTLVCQGFAAAGGFRFLFLYVGGLVVEAASIAVWHRSPGQVALMVVGIQGITLVLLLAAFRMTVAAPAPGARP